MAMGKIDSVVFDEGALICALALDLRFLANKADEDGDDIKTEEVPLTTHLLYLTSIFGYLWRLMH